MAPYTYQGRTLCPKPYPKPLNPSGTHDETPETLRPKSRSPKPALNPNSYIANLVVLILFRFFCALFVDAASPGLGDPRV